MLKLLHELGGSQCAASWYSFLLFHGVFLSDHLYEVCPFPGNEGRRVSERRSDWSLQSRTHPSPSEHLRIVTCIDPIYGQVRYINHNYSPMDGLYKSKVRKGQLSNLETATALHLHHFYI